MLRGTMWGSAPRPGRGLIPCTPLFGASPQREQKFVGVILLWPCVPIWGFAPKPRARILNTDKKKVRSEKAAPLMGPPQHIEKTCKVSEDTAFPFSSAPFPSIMRLRAKRLARGLGRSPKWERKAKAERTHQTLYPFGAKPQIVGCRGLVPCRGLGWNPNVPL